MSTPLGKQLIYFLCGFGVQAVAFGGYSVISILSTRMLLRRGLKTPANRNLLTITLSMYSLAFVYCTYCFVNTATRVQAFVNEPSNPAPHIPEVRFLAFFNALATINFIMSDGLIVWRARLICAPEHRKYMLLPCFFAVIGGLSVMALIGLRIAEICSPVLDDDLMLVRVIDFIQISALNLSLISNLTTTAVVGVTAWQHRQTVRDGFKESTEGDRILKLLLESGVVYCLFGIGGLVSTFIRLPYNTLGDLYVPISVIFASAYTPAILLLVHSKRDLNEPTFLGSIQLEDVSFPQFLAEPKALAVVAIGPVPQHKSSEVDLSSLGTRSETSTVVGPLDA
ncbi:Arsenical pump-driving ATPase [Mycena kentingensis (nom. inval.)]|nr:Arsenical pump-driving ATPase [Mycena kentingensis (nom. inval.)]